MKRLLSLISLLIFSLVLIQWSGMMCNSTGGDTIQTTSSEIRNSQLTLSEALKCKDLSTDNATVALRTTAPFRTLTRTLSKTGFEGCTSLNTTCRCSNDRVSSSFDGNIRGAYRSSNIILAICNMLL